MSHFTSVAASAEAKRKRSDVMLRRRCGDGKDPDRLRATIPSFSIQVPDTQLHWARYCGVVRGPLAPLLWRSRLRHSEPPRPGAGRRSQAARSCGR
eukprot:scaffold109_cov252-Pinguiococcus_pyrenoidosus.AAC.62